MLGRVFAFLTFVLLSAPALAEEAAHAPEHKAAMPQLDPTYYISQIFWLLVCGIALYVLLAKVALPRVSKMVDLRDRQVQQDLELAFQLKQEAENLKIAYTNALRDADEKAKTLLDGVMRKAREEHSKQIEASVERFNTQVAAMESTLRKDKDALLKDAASISDRLADVVVDGITKKAA